ncbi:hypothetical protein OK016_10345 [Vibrio chagasii]|nr:hypothetical protein [Vibrio chagasii]
MSSVKQIPDLPQIIFSDASLIDEAGEVIDDGFFRYQGLSDKVLERVMIFCSETAYKERRFA